MIKSLCLLVLVCSAAIARADLTLEQQSSNTNATHRSMLKIHADEMRLENPDQHFDVLVDLGTRNSYTLITTNHLYIQRFGSDARWEVEEEKKMSGGTNAMDFPAAPAVATGKSERVNGYDSDIYTWFGARGISQTLWVAKAFPNYEVIRTELAKLDQFNATGLHPNAQPAMSLLPGMVVKSVTEVRTHLTTNTLLSANIDPLDPALFTLPADYKEWKRPVPTPPSTNTSNTVSTNNTIKP